MMQAMVLHAAGQPLKLEQVSIPQPAPKQVLIKVHACALCRTDLHVVDGELNEPKLPLIPGHQIVGVIERCGSEVNTLQVGQRVGVPWLGGSCGVCDFCAAGSENLCDHAQYTGYQINGGFAEYCVANSAFCFELPDGYPDLQAAPLLCAGLIGYRAFRKTKNPKKLGVYGFGAAAHILTQVAVHQNIEVIAVTRAGDDVAQNFAKELGAVWAGVAQHVAEHSLDAAIIFAPAGELVPSALRAVRKGGTVVCGGIHMSDIPSFPYNILWGERTLCSVANLTRQDGDEFLALAPQVPVETKVNVYELAQVNAALNDLREGRITGSAVIQI